MNLLIGKQKSVIDLANTTAQLNICVVPDDDDGENPSRKFQHSENTISNSKVFQNGQTKLYKLKEI